MIFNLHNSIIDMKCEMNDKVEQYIRYKNNKIMEMVNKFFNTNYTNPNKLVNLMENKRRRDYEFHIKPSNSVEWFEIYHKGKLVYTDWLNKLKKD